MSTDSAHSASSSSSSACAAAAAASSSAQPPAAWVEGFQPEVRGHVSALHATSLHCTATAHTALCTALRCTVGRLAHPRRRRGLASRRQGCQLQAECSDRSPNVSLNSRRRCRPRRDGLQKVIRRPSDAFFFFLPSLPFDVAFSVLAWLISPRASRAKSPQNHQGPRLVGP